MDFCLANLAKMTLHLVCNEILLNIMPSIHAKWAEEQHNIPIQRWDMPEQYLSYDGFLYLHHLKSISPSTVWQWVHYIGFRYSERCKSYYVDGHEHEDVVKKWIEFCAKYLLEDEPHCLHWKCIPFQQALQINELVEQLGKTVVCTEMSLEMVQFHGGHEFTNENGKKYIEFHEDDVEGIKAIENLPLQMSNQAPAGCKPLIIIRQDEVILWQYLVGTHFWTGPNGEVPMLPKSDGAVIMASAFMEQDISLW